jgi:hypothetical protein
MTMTPLSISALTVSMRPPHHLTKIQKHTEYPTSKSVTSSDARVADIL